MVRVLGNSHERVLLQDLKDVVYYKQIKEYTDQEFTTSKDLRREIQSCRLIVLEQALNVRGSSEIAGDPAERSQSPPVSIGDFKAALRELLPKLKQEGSDIDLKGALREIAPLIVSMVRQEISGLKTQQQTTSPEASNYQGIEYIPVVSTEGMISNVQAKENKVSGDDAENALAALRKLRKS